MAVKGWWSVFVAVERWLAGEGVGGWWSGRATVKGWWSARAAVEG